MEDLREMELVSLAFSFHCTWPMWPPSPPHTHTESDWIGDPHFFSLADVEAPF